MFIGRNQELKKLNKMYESGRLEVAVIYGRRRVGKTTLITEFCKDKKQPSLRRWKTVRTKTWKPFPKLSLKSIPTAAPA